MRTYEEDGSSAIMETSRRRWLGVFALLIVVTIAYVDRVNVSVLVLDRTFLQTFGLVGDRAGQGLLMTLFLVGYGISALIVTPFYEGLLGTRKGLVVSILVWGGLTAISPLCATLPLLLAARFILGVAEGPLFSLKVMYVADRFPAASRGKPNSVSSMGVSLGLAIGYPLMAAMLQMSSWAASFRLLAILNVALGLPLVLLFVRSTVRPTSRALIRPSQRLLRTIQSAAATRLLGLILPIEVCTLAYLWGSSFWLPAYLMQDRHFSLTSAGWISASICDRAPLRSLRRGYRRHDR